jgi:hypothetical protein
VSLELGDTKVYIESRGENCDATVEDSNAKSSAACAWYRFNISRSTADGGRGSRSRQERRGGRDVARHALEEKIRVFDYQDGHCLLTRHGRGAQSMELAVGMVGNATMEKVPKGFAFLEIFTSLKDSTFSRLRAVADIHHACRWRRPGSCNIIVREAEVGRNDREIAMNSDKFCRSLLPFVYVHEHGRHGRGGACGGRASRKKKKRACFIWKACQMFSCHFRPRNQRNGKRVL